MDEQHFYIWVVVLNDEIRAKEYTAEIRLPAKKTNTLRVFPVNAKRIDIWKGGLDSVVKLAEQDVVEMLDKTSKERGKWPLDMECIIELKNTIY